jgi:fumarate reductase subunit C
LRAIKWNANSRGTKLANCKSKNILEKYYSKKTFILCVVEGFDNSVMVFIVIAKGFINFNSFIDFLLNPMVINLTNYLLYHLF